MNQDKHPEALRLAAWLGAGKWPSYVPQQSAAELRRLQTSIAELEAELAAVKAAPAAQAVGDERAKFEEWAEKNYCAKEDLVRGRITGYRNPELNQLFRGWAARSSLAAPQAQAQDVQRKRWLEIGNALERACKELPEGAEIQIYLERGAGTVHMTDWDGNEVDHFDEDHEDFACRINAAIDGAIAAEQDVAQAKQGGEA